MTQDLQYRLYNADIPPPADAWTNIIEQLDSDTRQKLSIKIQQATIEPPTAAWDNILSQLEGKDQARVIPIGGRWKKIAIAAVAIGILLLAGLTYYMSEETTDPDSGLTKQQVTPPVNNNDTQADKPVDAPATTSTQVQSYAGTSAAIAIPVARRNNPPTRVRYARIENTELRATNAENNMNVVSAIDQPVTTRPDAYIEPKDYLTVTAPNGQPARISAKFTDAVGYMYTDEPADNLSAALKSISWKRRFRSWSNKLMSNPAFIPAATNFFDIVELEELLKE